MEDEGFRREIEEEFHRENEELSVEKSFDGQRIPTWREPLTVRAFVASLVLGVLFTFICMKSILSVGHMPHIHVSAVLLGFFFVKAWTKILEKFGMLKQQLTRQETTLIKTCVIASSGIAFSGGFGTYIFAMSSKIGGQYAEPTYSENIKNPDLGWMMAFVAIVSFVGIFAVLPLSKIMIIDFRLPYPSGTATAHLINSFHTPQGTNVAREKAMALGKSLSLSFFWSFFQWFYTSRGDCGFAKFPTFGLQAYTYKFYFDFSATYVGIGMISPYISNISMLVGAILSWGIMWPLIEHRRGDWYPEDVGKNNLHGLEGYKVFITIAVILGDGIYNFMKILYRTIQAGMAGGNSPVPSELSYDDEKRTSHFLHNQIPTWIALSCYAAISVISMVTLPQMFQPLKWYHIIVIYLVAPLLAFCNAYGTGVTDWSFASTYGKLAIFCIGAWAGAEHGGVLAGLDACGVLMNTVSTVSSLMEDFKTGYMTLDHPKSMFVSQLIGTAMGCVISPSTFYLFIKAYKSLGSPGSEYNVPYAHVYLNMARLGVEGFGSLPKHCLTLSFAF